jgi:hypothetical protein
MQVNCMQNVFKQWHITENVASILNGMTDKKTDGWTLDNDITPIMPSQSGDSSIKL